MTEFLPKPILVFRFALREGDWLLAAAIAHALRGRGVDAAGLDSELARHVPAGADRPSLGALRVFRHLVRALGLGCT